MIELPYLDLPIDEQGPVRDFIKGDIRAEMWRIGAPGLRALKSAPQAF